MPSPTTPEQYEEMWQAYCREQTIAGVARLCNVSEGTARRYIVRGDPKRNLRPLLDRWKEARAKVDKEEINDLAQAQRGSLKAAQYAKEIAIRQLKRLKRDKNGAFRDPMKAVKIAHELEALIHGEPTQRHEFGGGAWDDPFAGLDDTEVMEFLEDAVPKLRAYGYGKPTNGHQTDDPNALFDATKTVH